MTKARDLADLGGVTTRLDQVGNTDGALSNRNLIINGAMQVAQRGAQGGTSSTASGIKTVDRFGCISGVSTITQSQNSLTSSDTPYASGFRSSYRATVTTASSSATSFVQLEQRIEAQNIAQSGWDYTNSNSSLTLSFWAKSSLAGTYYVQFRTADDDSYYYNKSFTLASNTWSKVTCTIAGNSNLVIDTDNGEGLRVLVIPDYGTDYSGHAIAVEESWYIRTESSGYTPAFAQDWRNTSGATFDITGVQLEAGDTATPFEHRSYGDELQKCMRFFQKKIGRFASGYAVNSNTTANVRPDFSPNMRATPTMSVISLGNILREGVAWYPITNATISEASNQNSNIQLTIAGTHTMSEGHATVIGNGAIYDFDAEL